MKIFCIGRNYAEHTKELKNDIPESPVVFMKPQTALLKDNKPFYLPSFSKEMHYETELVFRIGKNGKSVQAKYALSYIDAFTVGIDFTARDLQSVCKQKGLPWEIAKSFDNSAAIGTWLPINESKDIQDINFSLLLNGIPVQKGNSKDMLFSLDKIIAYISVYFTLQQGDIIFTGTPVGVSSVKIGDVLEAFIEEKSLLKFEIK
jgi:2-keto-4-pentenoate hydratase/2-oxohepta-3-ene-1,7-dioic acid hydratase in catechol pathway